MILVDAHTLLVSWRGEYLFIVSVTKLLRPLDEKWHSESYTAGEQNQ